MAANVSEREPLLDYEGAAAVLSGGQGTPTKSTLQVWVSTGRYGIPYLKIGRAVRFRKSALEAWLASRERGVTAEAR